MDKEKIEKIESEIKLNVDFILEKEKVSEKIRHTIFMIIEETMFLLEENGYI